MGIRVRFNPGAVLIIILFALTLVSCLVLAVTTAATWVLCRSASGLPLGTRPISVLKPVQGLDDELEENLASFCRQNHPQFELVIGAADPSDPALAVARRVQARFPHVEVRVVTGEWSNGLNPKVRNLRNLMQWARYPAVLVSDGDVRARPDYLRVLAGAIEQPGVGLVSNLVVGVGERTLGSMCDNLQLNTFVAGNVAAADVIAKHPIVVGKSMLFHRDSLVNIGGFAAAADILAEDYFLGRAVSEAGYRVVTLGYPVQSVNRSRSLPCMLRRHLRWSQIRRQVAPGIFALEPLAHPTFWATLLLSVIIRDAWASTAGSTGLIAALLLMLLLVALESLAYAVLLERAMRLQHLLCLPLRSALVMLAWFGAWATDVVVWRGHAFRIGRGSRLTPLVHSRLRTRPERAGVSVAV